MKTLNFTIIKLTICLIAGIIIGYYFSFSLNHILYTISILFTFLLIAYIVAKKHFFKTIWFGILSYLLMVSLGVITVYSHNERNFKNHYSNYISHESDSLKTVTFSVREVLKPTPYYDKYIVDILRIGSEKVNGKVLLNVQKDSTSTSLGEDTIFLSKTSFELVNPPLNPGQFNYKKYLEKKIYLPLTFYPKKIVLYN